MPAVHVGMRSADVDEIAALKQSGIPTFPAHAFRHPAQVAEQVIACLDALLTVPCLHILDGREPHALLCELFSGKSAGTVIVGSRE